MTWPPKSNKVFSCVSLVCGCACREGWGGGILIGKVRGQSVAPNYSVLH